MEVRRGLFLAPNARGAGVIPFPSSVWNGAEALFIGSKVGAALLALGAKVCHKKLPSPKTAFLGGQGVLLLGVALAQALVEFGESDRYSVPMQPLSLAMVLVAWTWWREARSQGQASAVTSSTPAPSAGCR